MSVRRLVVAIVLVALCAVPATAGATLAGTHHASRAYLVKSGPQAGEMTLRIVARYPARPRAMGPGPFYGYTEVTLRGPGGTLRLHDLDRLSHPRRAEQVDHRIELSRSRAKKILGAKGRRARLTLQTRSVVLGPMVRVIVQSTAPLTQVAVPLRWVSAVPPDGGTIFTAPGNSITIGYALDPNEAGAYDAMVTSLAGSALSFPIFTDLTIAGNGVLMTDAIDPTADFSATFSLTGNAGMSAGFTCPGSAAGTISDIEPGYDGAFYFDEVSYSATWSSIGSRSAGCSEVTNGTISSTSVVWEPALTTVSVPSTEQVGG